jgi:hypothetical protein
MAISKNEMILRALMQPPTGPFPLNPSNRQIPASLMNPAPISPDGMGPFVMDQSGTPLQPNTGGWRQDGGVPLPPQFTNRDDEAWHPSPVQPNGPTFGDLRNIAFGKPSGSPGPTVTMASGSPQIPMGGGLGMLGNTSQAPGWGQMPIPQSSPSPNMPAPNASNAGPVPIPPQRPFMPSQAPAAVAPPMPPQRPEGVGFNDPLALIRGFNPQAFTGNPQAYADQFANGDMSRIGGRTYRNEDGTMWNDFYLLNPGAQ